MHITVQCPACHNEYKLNPDMRGKRMRCVNNLCREIFEVRDGSLDGVSRRRLGQKRTIGEGSFDRGSEGGIGGAHDELPYRKGGRTPMKKWPPRGARGASG